MNAGTKPLLLLARLGLAGVLGYAGLSKLADPSGMAETIANYQMLPEALVPFAAVIVPAAEIVVAAALVAGPCVQGGGIVAALMLTAFAVGMAQARLRGIDLECGCFGAGSESLVSWPKVAMNVGLAALAAVVAWARPVAWREALPRGPEHREEAPG